jgi:DNA-binding transcriptional ArsR family regulator
LHFLFHRYHISWQTAIAAFSRELTLDTWKYSVTLDIVPANANDLHSKFSISTVSMHMMHLREANLATLTESPDEQRAGVFFQRLCFIDWQSVLKAQKNTKEAAKVILDNHSHFFVNK